MVDDAAIAAAGHHVLVLGAAAEEERGERREVDLVGVLSLVHREQRAQGGADVRVDRGEQLGHRLVEVEAGLERAEVGSAEREPRHRAGERVARLDVGEDAVDAVEHRRAERDAGRRGREPLDPERVDERAASVTLHRRGSTSHRGRRPHRRGRSCGCGPPIRSRPSTTTTSTPLSRSARAATSPEIPAPTTTTRSTGPSTGAGRSSAGSPTWTIGEMGCVVTARSFHGRSGGKPASRNRQRWRVRRGRSWMRLEMTSQSPAAEATTKSTMASAG